MTAPLDLDASVAALHARLDAWALAVRAAADSDVDDDAVLDDPRLTSAEEEFDHAVTAFQFAALDELGVEAPEDDDSDLEVEELALHVLVGVPDGGPEPARDATSMVHEAGARLVAQLTAAGYQVPSWVVGCPTELLLDESDDDEDDFDLDDGEEDDGEGDEDDGDEDDGDEDDLEDDDDDDAAAGPGPTATR